MRKELFRAQGVDVFSEQGPVLQNISLQLYESEILGAYEAYNDGMQALLDLIQRRRRPTAGTVFFFGIPYTDENVGALPRVYRVSGYETLNDSLSLMENVLLLRGEQRGLKLTNPRAMRRYLSTLFQEYGIRLSPEIALGSLSPIDHFMLELLKARLDRADIAVVSDFNLDGDPEQNDQLWRLMRRLVNERMSILITSHRFGLLRRYADRIALLSNGTIIKTAAVDQAQKPLLDQVFASVVGDRDSALCHTAPAQAAPVLCTVPELPVGSAAGPALTLRQGELVELLDPTGGAVRRLKPDSRKDIFFLNAPVADLIIEDLSLADNLCLDTMERMSLRGVLRRGPEELIQREFAQWYGSDSLIDLKNCKSLNRTERVAVVLFRLRLRHPKVLFCINVRRELNPMSRRFMMSVVRELLESGSAVCLVDANDGDYESGADRVFVADTNGILTQRKNRGEERGV
jgi:ABC-type multidrug transport system ATPase subunit